MAYRLRWAALEVKLHCVPTMKRLLSLEYLASLNE
jgi:hypothetical protein